MWKEPWQRTKTKDEVISENGYYELDQIGSGEIISREGSKRIPVKKKYKVYNAKSAGQDVRIMVIDKITGKDLTSQLFEMYNVVASEKEWMLLQKKNNNQ